MSTLLSLFNLYLWTRRVLLRSFDDRFWSSRTRKMRDVLLIKIGLSSSYVQEFFFKHKTNRRVSATSERKWRKGKDK